MKNRFELLAAGAALVLIIASGAIAQPGASEKRTLSRDLIFQNFESSFDRKEYPGIVESTVYNVVIYKNRFPDADYSRVVSMLQRVVKENGDAAIRYKAQLAYMYLSDSPAINLSVEQAPANHEYLFKQISEQLEQKFLASHTTE